eukprot:2955333-Prymnesium_polylepis.1
MNKRLSVPPPAHDVDETAAMGSRVCIAGSHGHGIQLHACSQHARRDGGGCSVRRPESRKYTFSCFFLA